MKITKIVFPLVVIALAIAGSFAAGAMIEPDLVVVPVNVTSCPSNCIIDGTCSNMGSVACELPCGTPFYAIVSPGTCVVRAVGIFSCN